VRVPTPSVTPDIRPLIPFLKVKNMLKDKSIAITGSAKGIGRYIASRFAQEVAKVAILDVDEERLAQTHAELAGFGGQVLAIPTDVKKEDTIRLAMAEVAEKFGGLDVREEHVIVEQASGEYLERPGLDRLRSLVRAQLIDAAVVYD
jgi:NAD(P)-dependent dehydrogenase (short-subunit alcohol dehydrogenase family)